MPSEDTMNEAIEVDRNVAGPVRLRRRRRPVSQSPKKRRRKQASVGIHQRSNKKANW